MQGKQRQISRVRRLILEAEFWADWIGKEVKGIQVNSSQDGKLPAHGLTSWQKGWREMKIFCFISTKWTSKQVFLLHLSSCSSVEGKRSSAGQLLVQKKVKPKIKQNKKKTPKGNTVLKLKLLLEHKHSSHQLGAQQDRGSTRTAHTHKLGYTYPSFENTERNQVSHS